MTNIFSGEESWSEHVLFLLRSFCFLRSWSSSWGGARASTARPSTRGSTPSRTGSSLSSDIFSLQRCKKWLFLLPAVLFWINCWSVVRTWCPRGTAVQRATWQATCSTPSWGRTTSRTTASTDLFQSINHHPRNMATMHLRNLLRFWFKILKNQIKTKTMKMTNIWRN